MKENYLQSVSAFNAEKEKLQAFLRQIKTIPFQELTDLKKIKLKKELDKLAVELGRAKYNCLRECKLLGNENMAYKIRREFSRLEMKIIGATLDLQLSKSQSETV